MRSLILGAPLDPTPAGIATAREAVSGYYGGTVDPGRIMLTASTSEAYAHIFKLLCDPGDEVLVPQPAVLFSISRRSRRRPSRAGSLHYTHGWYIDLDALSSAVTDRTRAIVFRSIPTTPPVHFFKLQQYEVMSTLCRRCRHGVDRR